MFYIDGTGYSMPCDIKREAKVRSSDISGYLMDNSYHNDAIAVYMQYTVSLVVPKGMESNYYDLYNKLASAENSHTFIFPYNNSYIQFDGLVSSISDELYFGRWRKIQFVATATTPNP